jgi:tetratricopeptide (TPR) repeat protein
LVLLGRFDEALEAYQAAQRIRPDSLDPVAGLASVHERRREYRQAFEVLWPHIDAGAEHVGVVTAAAGLCRRFNRCDQVAALAERILESHATAERDRAALHFQLGQIYDRRQEFERAFVHFQQGNRLKQDQFDIDAHRAVVDELIEVFGREGLARMPRASRSAERVVLVVGMPRSGTSLVEQILASHPAVFGAGELPDIGHLTLRLPALPGRSTGYPRTVTGISQSQLDDLAAAYHDRLRQLSPDARRVTDKMPQNFLHLGFVELLFPQAKIIHCLRDPMDSCLSCYFHLFGGYHPYAYDLRDLGLYYREYRRLMAHWKTALSLPMLEIAYEDVVDRQEEMSRALVAFCGLDWDEACLRFHLSERYVNTASYDQVRRPIYRDSVARWRHYENHLGPLRDALGDAGAHVHHAGAS